MRGAPNRVRGDRGIGGFQENLFILHNKKTCFCEKSHINKSKIVLKS